MVIKLDNNGEQSSAESSHSQQMIELALPCVYRGGTAPGVCLGIPCPYT